MTNMNKIVVLGNSGFIGKYLYDKLSIQYKTYGLSSVECNLLNIDEVKKTLVVLKKNDILILCSSITRLMENSIESMNKNILMAQNIALVINNIKIKQLIFLSTIDVYGVNIIDEYISEDTQLNPYDYYATSKVVSEFILRKVCKENNINLFIARLSGVYGHGDKNKSTIYALVSSAIKNKKIILYNKGLDSRDFISIEYLFNIILNSIKINYDGTLNIATGQSFTIKDIAYIIKKFSGDSIEIVYKKEDLNSRVNDIKFNISKLRDSKLLNKKVDFNESINKYIRDYCES